MSMILSYDIRGLKEEFADWISNISPYDTPFVSMTGKAPVYNKVFEWQSDRLAKVAENAWSEEKENLPDSILSSTTLHNNYTQILRKVVQVSHTANAFANYGRGKELEYQIEKASKEIKRDLEAILLSDQRKDEGAGTGIRKLEAFYHLVAGLNEKDPETGAVVHTSVSHDDFTEEDLFTIFKGLYMVGSRANTIMYHPIHAGKFAKLLESGNGTRKSIYNPEDKTFSHYVQEYRDPLGTKWDLIPNDNMDKRFIYFFHPHDWFQRVLRSPKAIQLDSEGSYDKWMIEMEVSLQHRNPFGSGILEFSGISGD